MENVSKFVGGNIKHYIKNWELFTNDPILLEMVSGVKIKFIKIPEQIYVPNEISCSLDESIAIEAEIEKFESKEIIVKAEHCDGEFISHIFTRPKPNGSVRVILNLSKLNVDIEYEHFKMENLSTALNLIEPDCFMGSIDLKDAYYSVNVATKFRKFMRFIWKSTLYEFTCLPMGLCCAPRIFTKLLKPLFCYLRSIGLLSVYYLDDTLLFGETMIDCEANLLKTAKVLESVGFTINREKSVLIPFKKIKFLGFFLDSEKMIVTLPKDKCEKIKKFGNELLETEFIQIQSLASFIGILVSCFPAVFFGPLYYRYLERNKTSGLVKSKGDFNAWTVLNQDSKNEINWWIANIDSSFKNILETDIKTSFISDASKLGWGAVWKEVSTGGRWTEIEVDLHINVLELKAILFGLQSFFNSEHDIHIRIKTDSMTALSYVTNLGGTKSLSCHRVAKDI